MATGRYVRWQGLAISQLSIAVSLISGLSAVGISFGVKLINEEPTISFITILMAIFSLGLAATCSAGAVVTRLLDFRLTARKVRKDEKPNYSKPLVIFGRNKEEYGRATWRLFWTGQLTFLIGFTLLAVAYGNVVISRIVTQ